MTSTVSHVDLLAIARRVRRAVERDDAEDLHAELSRLRSELLDHVHAERPQLDALPDPEAAIALQGQQRLVRLLTEVLFEQDDGVDPGACTCVVRAAEIELALRRQVRLETSLLRHRPGEVRPANEGRSQP